MSEPQVKKSSGNWGCLLVGLIGTVLVVRACSGDGGQIDSAKLASATVSGANTVTSTPENRVIEQSNWSYDRRRDEVRNRDVVTASIRSENSANLDFPYQGDNYLNLTIRKHPEYGLDVVIQVDKGQILCHSYSEPCKGMMNIDGRAERLSFVESADNDSSAVFVRYPAGLVKKMKKAKSVIIELPFYRNGNVQFKFDSKGLEWPPK